MRRDAGKPGRVAAHIAAAVRPRHALVGRVNEGEIYLKYILEAETDEYR